MFDNLRDESDNSFYDEDEAKFQPAAGTPSKSTLGRSKSGRMMGMTAPQRFVIVFMLMIVVCILGSMCLLVTGKIGF